MAESDLVLFAAAWVPFNLGLHLAMHRVGMERRLHWMFGVLMWVAPFVGGLFAAIEVVQRRRALAGGPAPSPVEDNATAPALIAVPQGPAFDVLAHLVQEQGVPLLDWQAVEAWADGHDNLDDQRLARSIAGRGWLLHLRDALGNDFAVLETPTCLLLSSLPASQAQAMADYVANARQRIERVLAPLAVFPPLMKTVIVVFGSTEDYYHYVSLYYPDEGEFALSGGMFIGGPCPHFVMVQDDLHAIEPVIVHELTHSAMEGRHLPLWLDEGIAVSTERRVAGLRWVVPTLAEMSAKHANYWTPESVQAFWRGASFQRVDDGNSLSYDLAHRLVQHLSRDWPGFVRFVQSVERSDHGNGAVSAHYGFDLGSAAAAVLGLPPQVGWTPAAPQVPVH